MLEAWTLIYGLFVVLDQRIVLVTNALEWRLIGSWRLERFCHSGILTRSIFEFYLATFFHILQGLVFIFVSQRRFFAPVRGNCLWFFTFAVISLQLRLILLDTPCSWWLGSNLFLWVFNFWTLLTLSIIILNILDWRMQRGSLAFDLFFMNWGVKRRMFALGLLPDWRTLRRFLTF